MKYNKHICILLTLWAFIGAKDVNAQTTIGSDKAPEKFSMLEIDGTTGGLRLPRVATSNERDNIATTGAEAGGLVVYNVETKRIEFWDEAAQKWVALSAGYTANNGITPTATASNIDMKLGGAMIEATTAVNQNNNALAYTGGKYSVNTNMVVVDNNAVSITPSATGKYSVNSNVLSVEGKNIDMNPASLAVNSNALTANSSGFGVNGKLIYNDKTADNGYLLTTDATGKASWDALRPLGAVIRGKLNDNIDFASKDINLTTQSLTLSPGKWLIFAKYSSRMVANETGMYHWIKLHERDITNNGPWTEILRVGNTPERKENNIEDQSNFSYSTPNFMYMIDIKNQSEYIIQASTSNNRKDRTVSNFGGSYFYALRVDIPTP